MKQESSFRATSFKKIIITLVIIICLASIAGFYFAAQYLDTYAKDVQQQIAQANAAKSNNSLQSSQAIKNQIATYQTISDKISTLTTSNSDFKEKITSDLNKYAELNQISITSIDFVGSQAAVDGYSINSIKLSINNPVAYTNLYKFIKAVETNAPKIQITNLNISKNSNASIKVDSMTMEVYTR